MTPSEGKHAHGLLVITIRRCEGLRNSRLREDEVQPVQVGLVGICWGIGIGVERRRSASADTIQNVSVDVDLTIPDSPVVDVGGRE